MRKFVKYEISNVLVFKENLLHYANSFHRCCVLISNTGQENFTGIYSDRNEMIIAVDSIDQITPSENSFAALNRFHKEKTDWLFGFLTYDLKNEVESLSSENFDGINFPRMNFFQPKYVFILRNTKVEIGFLPNVSSKEEVATLFYEINSGGQIANCKLQIKEIKCRISKEEYIATVNKVKEHIHRGDVYEMNYCMEFFSEETITSPDAIFLRLNQTSQAPFSAFYRMGDKYLLCASPERFLKKEGKKIISQPIKGTSKRGATGTEDLEIKKTLSQNEKEKSENVMIVDLVRNDLSKTCDNVHVDELFGVYTFSQWHQMISTVSGEMRSDVQFVDVIKKSFPMGSMTGAPKVRAMELIEQYEKTKRGLYSGSIGYITPDADFDFNVVIRSILYNAASRYISFQVGSAITANSTAENEYEECLLKAKGMFEALNINANDALKISNDELNSLAHA
ncbi:MAG: anthranilate synthase component I family protein [Bacteroidetes bacterium]|nr:anthranilate synthase component I family protein [Bacteroidota bacterium]